jgi:hypothetical protein
MIGKTLAGYEITGKLGRNVTIKVLPDLSPLLA